VRSRETTKTRSKRPEKMEKAIFGKNSRTKIKGKSALNRQRATKGKNGKTPRPNLWKKKSLGRDWFLPNQSLARVLYVGNHQGLPGSTQTFRLTRENARKKALSCVQSISPDQKKKEKTEKLGQHGPYVDQTYQK